MEKTIYPIPQNHPSLFDDPATPPAMEASLTSEGQEEATPTAKSRGGRRSGAGRPRKHGYRPKRIIVREEFAPMASILDKKESNWRFELCNFDTGSEGLNDNAILYNDLIVCSRDGFHELAKTIKLYSNEVRIHRVSQTKDHFCIKLRFRVLSTILKLLSFITRYPNYHVTLPIKYKSVNELIVWANTPEAN